MSLGGDGTFLKTASLISSNALPILGVNTDPARSVGHLTSIPIPFLERHKEIPRLVDFLERGNFKFDYKNRIRIQCKSQISESVKTTYALNEVFVAEKNLGSSTIFRLKADDSYLGKFKSSGLIISTGTGSTGWLYSAKRVTHGDVEACLRTLGFQESEETIGSISNELSKQTAFSPNEPRLFYYVREPSTQGIYE